MRLFEFECKRCGCRFDQRVDADKLDSVVCKCGGKVRRVFSPPAIVFRGSGFHCNDYTKTGPKCT